MNIIKNNTGFSLFEVLITTVIASVSLLGIGILQLKTHQHNSDANFQSHATILAHDMIERMRANPMGIVNSSYHLPTATKKDSCYTTGGCSNVDMAENDMYEWAGGGALSITKVLPAGVGIVCLDSTPSDGTATSHACDNTGSLYAVKIWWTSISAKPQQFITTVGF
ncbi:MAG: type IV pilus modification protein PilV [Thiotrichaceae bacterium]|nr:type IV pilus modification protein PilV [Thiotrichaceae bacterium]